MLYAEKIQASIKEFSYSDKTIQLEKTTLTNTFFNLKKYEGETKLNLQFLINHFKKPKTTSSGWIFGINEVELINNRFNYDNQNAPKKKFGIDYQHISLTEVNLLATEIDLIEKGVDCKIERLSCKEKSDFQIKEMYTEANVSPSGIVAQNLKLITANSDIHGNVTLLTSAYSDFSNFVEAVTIKSYFETTKVHFKDISYYAPQMEGIEKWLNMEGEIKGKINNLKTRKFSFITDDGTRYKGDADISGLPNVEDMFLYVDVDELITTKEKIETIPVFPFTKKQFIKMPPNFRHLGAIRFSGNFTGFYHDIVAYGKLKTSIGSITTDLSLKMKNGKPYYKGKVKTNHFQLGKFFEMSKDIGDITMNVNVDGSGFSKGDLDVNVTGNINQVVIKNYEYNNAKVEGGFKDKIFNGFLAVADENISFDFKGRIDVSHEMPEFHFISNIENAKLGKLNLIKSKKKLKTRFSTQVQVDLVGDNMDNLVGDVKILNSRYNDKLDSIKVESILVTSEIADKIKTIKIKSDLLDATAKGEFYYKEVANFIDNFFTRYIPSQIDQQHQIVNLSHNIDFNVELHNSALLSKVLFKGIEMSDHTTLIGHYNATTHELLINGDAPFMNAYGVEIDDFSFSSKANEKVLDLVIDAETIKQSDSLYMDRFNISGTLQQDSSFTEISWANQKDTVKNDANITLVSLFNGYNHVSNTFINSYAHIADSLWQIEPNNNITIDTGYIAVKGLNIHNQNQSIVIDGKLSDNESDQIDILMKQFNLFNLKKVIPSDIIRLEGIIDGVASVGRKNGELLYTSDLQFDRFRVNESLIGKGSLEALWNTGSQSLKLDGKFYRDHIPTILFSGNYFPNEIEENLDLTLKLHQTELSVFDVYTKDHLSDLKGLANANISLRGNFKKPRFQGEISLLNLEFTVDYLKTRYKTKRCNINVVPDMISFDNVIFLDQNNHVAEANGTIYHEWFSDLSVDVGLNVNNFQALNTTELDNSLYYGKAYVTGLVNIGSYEKQMNIDVEVKTEKNTTINIPLSDNEDIVESNFIEFISNDTNDVELEVKEEIDLANIEMNFDLDITPDAEVRLIFDDQIGDVMRSRGSGNIKLNVNNDGDLNMFGNYVVQDGDYLFTLQNVINKRFDLEEGGKIIWNGDPYEAEIDLTAVYRLRARLYDLLVNIDTNDIYKKRVPVDLKLRMQNAMMNPDISFDIDLPTADEDTKNKVKSVLYVSDKEENIQELNKQVFSLLVLNTFLPPPGADAAYGHANVGTTTSSELLSNQLSNWLSKISNDFDIGVNYRPGDELSNQELELALSTQLFNDRLILDGNFGISDRQNVSSEAQNTNNLIGDISLEYKITKDGKLRAKAFNNSNQFSFQNINSPYTQGLGLSYKEEYDTGKEFWQKLAARFRRKKKKKNE